jgi:hypothetical protein
LSQWIVVWLKEGDPAGSIADLNLCIQGKVKLVLNGLTNLEEKLGLNFESESFQIDFNPSDKNSFVFSTKFGLYFSKINKTWGEIFQTPSIWKLDTSTISECAIVTSISYAD